MSFSFKTISPYDGFEVHMLEDLTYKATVSGVSSLEGEGLSVQAWTNAYDNYSTDGQWHSVELTLDKAQTRQQSTFSEKILIVANVDFEFKLRVRRKDISGGGGGGGGEWTWSGSNRRIRVLPLRSKDNWSPCLAYPDCQPILGPVYSGNEAAANAAAHNGFSHILCVAQELVIPKRVQESSGSLVYHQIAMIEGVTNSIQGDHLQEAIDWIMKNWKSTHKLLIYSKHGFGRAGSTLVAFILSQNRAMPYEEGIRNYSFRRFIFPHSGLQQTVEKLYPRL